jgi:peptide deformylase
MTLKILYWPDPVLAVKCAPVEQVTDEIRALLTAMEETMRAAHGVGLAAPQVGRALRAITVLQPDGTLLSLVNPRLELSPERRTVREGCLSLPGVSEVVERAVWVRVEALNRDGEPTNFFAEELMGQALQHEVEHLDGIVFVDHLSVLKRERARTRVRKAVLSRSA